MDILKGLRGKKTYLSALIWIVIGIAEVAGVAIAPWVYPVAVAASVAAQRAATQKSENARDRK